MPLPLKPEIVKLARSYFSGEQPAFATTLLAILFKTYGVQVLEWDNLTVQLQVREDFDVEMPTRVYDKLMALMTALSNDTIYRDVTFFDEFVSAINGRGFGTDEDIPAVDDVAWAVAELTINDPRPFGREPFWYQNIRIYTRVVLDDEGMDIPPQVLDFAETRTPKASVEEDPADYAGAWGGKQALADEVDNWISERMVALVQQLMEVGVDFSQRKKTAEEDVYLSHVAPEAAAESIRRNGLLSSLALAQDPASLELARPDEKERSEWLTRLADEKDDLPHRRGPNMFLSGPPAGTKLPDNHALKRPHRVFRVSLNKLLERYPDVKFHGLELEPIEKLDEQLAKDGINWDDLSWEQKKAYRAKRYREISADEVRALHAAGPEALWKHYSGTPGMYAPNVPHVSVITPAGKIDPDLLEELEKKAEWTSPANKDAHTDKHGWEFGGPEGYDKAELEVSTTPPADTAKTEQRCVKKRDGTMSCTTKQESAAKAMVWVKRDSDGKTVTLYKRL